MQPADLLYNSFGFYATIDLCGQIFLGAGRTWTTLEAGRIPVFPDVDTKNDMVAVLSQAMIYAHRYESKTAPEQLRLNNGRGQRVHEDGPEN